MAVLSDHIESFIKALLEDDGQGVVEMQRNELAQYFRCAPSQINYVLSTRFTVERGYIIESRRGGGGYIRVAKLDVNRDEYLHYLVTEGIGEGLYEDEAAHILLRMQEQQLVTPKEAGLMRAALTDRALGVPSPIRERVRARCV